MNNTADGLRRFTRAIRRSLVLALCIGVVACGAERPPQNDDEKLVQAMLGMMSGKGQQLCVDAATTGSPLTVFRAMIQNAPAGAIRPAWFQPAPFAPPAASEVDLLRGAGDAGHINQPTNDTPQLALPVQGALDRMAWALSGQNGRPVTIMPSWLAGMKARWWLRNRISFHCSPNYRLSNPIVSGDVGFVTVTAEHWGTTYAFVRRDSVWRARAQWSNWLY